MSDKKHELIKKLKMLAQELGRKPTKRDYIAVFGYDWEAQFGIWSMFLSAAGMATEQDYKEITAGKVNAFYQRKVTDFNVSKELNFKLKKYPKVFYFGDIHFPFQNDSAIKIGLELLKVLNPDYVVQTGDIYDQYSQKKFPGSIIILPQDEFKTSRDLAENFWARVKKITPHAKLVQIMGNHDLRGHKRMIENCPELEPFFNFKPYFEFNGVHTHHDAREPFFIEDIAIVHGFTQHGRHRQKTLTHTVHSHLHHGGCTYNKIDGRLLWELDVGYLGDPSKKCFSYTPMREQKWTPGVGFTNEYGTPRFFPFE